MKDLGLTNYFLGLEVWQRPSEIFLSQGKYIVKLLERFVMVDCKSVSTPMELNFKKLSGSAARLVLANPTEYHQLVGALMFLVNTHPDVLLRSTTLPAQTASEYLWSVILPTMYLSPWSIVPQRYLKSFLAPTQ